MEGISDEELDLLLAQGCFDEHGVQVSNKSGASTKATSTINATTNAASKRKVNQTQSPKEKKTTTAQLPTPPRQSRNGKRTTTTKEKARGRPIVGDDLDASTRLALFKWEEEAIAQALLASTSDDATPLALG